MFESIQLGKVNMQQQNIPKFYVCNRQNNDLND